MITGANAVTVMNVPGITGTLGLTNIQNVTGGSGNDVFMLNGGTLSGSINGGGGTNTLVADGTNNTWNINGTNTGSVTGISGNFSNIQNITGSSTSNNTFVFAQGAAITGSINGGSLANTNTLNYSGYSSPMTITLSSTFSGNTSNGGSYSNINQLIGNYNNAMIQIPSNKAYTVVFTGNRQGYINDPIFFFGFDVSGGTTPATPSSNPNVAAIIQQPVVNGESSANSGTTSTPQWIMTSDFTAQNLTDVVNDFTQEYNEALKKITINPSCFVAH